MKLEDELRQIEESIRKVKVQYDLYFSGVNSRPPNDMREALAKRVAKLQRGIGSSAADRFLSTSVVNKFNAFMELWAKGTRNKEEGTRLHPLAARAARRKARASVAPQNARTAPPAQPLGGTTAPPPPNPSAAWRLSTSQKCDDTIKGLYETYLAAKARTGDPKHPSFDAFAREIKRQTALFMGKVDCEAVEFRVYCKDNKVTIKARPGA